MGPQRQDGAGKNTARPCGERTTGKKASPALLPRLSRALGATCRAVPGEGLPEGRALGVRTPWSMCF